MIFTKDGERYEVIVTSCPNARWLPLSRTWLYLDAWVIAQGEQAGKAWRTILHLSKPDTEGAV